MKGEVMMKKIISLLCVIALAAMMITGCSQQKGSQAEYVSADAAKLTALEASGLKESEVENLTADLSTKNGVDYYQVAFKTADKSYTYDVDALTGTVIESHTYNNGGNNQQTSGDMITEDEAKTIALEKAGKTNDEVTFIQSKLDMDDGRQVYDVEFYTADYKEYDYEIDAYTGEVVSFDYDAEHYSQTNTSGGTMTADEAKELALSQVPGATASDIREFETDYDDGRTEYEGKIVYDGMEYEFEIDASNGKILSRDAESIYD